MKVEDVLREIAEQTAECTLCKLHFSRKKAVPGSGNPHTSIMFIGEGPGFHENQQGLPFVGAAGKFLDELLEIAGLSRGEVFITNVVKCRPPGNRDPSADELEACKPYLDRQINAINPDVIVTLGRISMGYFVTNGKISSIHGRKFWSNGRMIVPMYHPAAALHQPSLKDLVKADFARLPALAKEAQETRESNPNLTTTSQIEDQDEANDDGKTEQLSLF